MKDSANAFCTSFPGAIFDLVVISPPLKGVRRQLGAIVADDGLCFAVRDQQPIKFAGNPDTEDRRVGANARHAPMI